MLGTLRSFFELVESRGFAKLRELFTSDFVWHVSGPKRFAGDYHGFDEWMKYVAMLQREVGDTMKLKPIEFMVGDRHASVFMHVSRERNGRVHENEAVQVCRFDGDHIAEVWFLDTDPVEIEAFYS